MSWGWTLLFMKSGTWLKVVLMTTAYVLLKRTCDQNDRLRRQHRIDEAEEKARKESWRIW